MKAILSGAHCRREFIPDSCLCSVKYVHSQAAVSELKQSSGADWCSPASHPALTGCLGGSLLPRRWTDQTAQHQTNLSLLTQTADEHHPGWKELSIIIPSFIIVAFFFLVEFKKHNLRQTITLFFIVPLFVHQNKVKKQQHHMDSPKYPHES